MFGDFVLKSCFCEILSTFLWMKCDHKQSVEMHSRPTKKEKKGVGGGRYEQGPKLIRS